MSAPSTAAEEVDDPFRVRLGGADLREIRSEQVRDHDPAAFVDVRPFERPREQLQLGELNGLVDALEHAVDVGSGLHELRREPERLRRGVRVLEAAGVGDEGDVERLGDVRGQLDVQFAEEIAKHLARR